MAYPYTITSRAAGSVLTANIYNADHQNHPDSQTPQNTDDYSSNLAQMQATTDPGELASESLATALFGEIERLRFAIKDLKTTYDSTLAQWYQTPTGLKITGVGPHAIGGATTSNVMLFLTGTSALERSLYIGTTINPPASASSAGMWASPIINKAGSGVHADFASLMLDAPTIGAGAATLTNASTLKISGAPSVGTNQYALWIAAGGTRIQGLGAFAGGDKYVIVDANGNLHISGLGPVS